MYERSPKIAKTQDRHDPGWPRPKIAKSKITKALKSVFETYHLKTARFQRARASRLDSSSIDLKETDLNETDLNETEANETALN